MKDAHAVQVVFFGLRSCTHGQSCDCTPQHLLQMDEQLLQMDSPMVAVSSGVPAMFFEKIYHKGGNPSENLRLKLSGHRRMPSKDSLGQCSHHRSQKKGSSNPHIKGVKAVQSKLPALFLLVVTAGKKEIYSFVEACKESSLTADQPPASAWL